MNFANKMTDWKNKGTEPSSDLIQKGFQGGYKPPASIFNWQFGKTFDAITELQNAVNTIENKKASATELGGVKVGTNLSIDENGVLSADAQKIDVDSELNSTSTNAVQNKAVHTALSGKANSSHNHAQSDITGLSTALAGKSNTGHTHDPATQSSNGFLSSTDKKKLDGIAEGANKYSLPTASSTQLGGVKVGAGLNIDNGVLSATGTDVVIDTALSSSSTNPVQNKVINSALAGKASSSHSHNAATQSASGFLSATDKKKLDGIAEGANKTTVDSAMSSSSTNPVQNKVVNTALGNKVDKVSGKGLSTNDYTTSEKNKLAGIAAGANAYTHPTYTPKSSGLYKVTVDSSGHISGATAVTKSDITNLGIPSQDTTYSNATTSSAGLMSADDKFNLDYAYANTIDKSSYPFYYDTYDRLYIKARKGDSVIGEGAVDFGYENNATARGTFFGKYCKEGSGFGSWEYQTDTATLLAVGYGTSSTPANAFRINGAGKCYSNGVLTQGADYARLYEWLDGNPNDEDRRGLFVVMDGEKIRYADENDDMYDIEGIVSANPAFIENAPDEWHGKYEKDIFGGLIQEYVTIPEKIDETTGKIIPEHTALQFKVSPEYDPTKEYINREQRKEYDYVGFSGFIVAIDDGTCEVNGYCKPSKGGIATKSTEKTPYKVMARKDDTHIKVRIK